MQKFKALFKRSQGTGRGRHIENLQTSTTAVQQHSANPTPFSHQHPPPPSGTASSSVTSISCSSSVCEDESGKVAVKLSETMSEKQLIDKLKSDIQKHESLLTDLQSENELLTSRLKGQRKKNEGSESDHAEMSHGTNIVTSTPRSSIECEESTIPGGVVPGPSGDDSKIMKDKRVRKWLQEQSTNIPTPLRHLHPLQTAPEAEMTHVSRSVSSVEPTFDYGSESTMVSGNESKDESLKTNEPYQSDESTLTADVDISKDGTNIVTSTPRSSIISGEFTVPGGVVPGPSGDDSQIVKDKRIRKWLQEQSTNIPTPLRHLHPLLTASEVEITHVSATTDSTSEPSFYEAVKKQHTYTSSPTLSETIGSVTPLGISSDSKPEASNTKPSVQTTSSWEDKSHQHTKEKSKSVIVIDSTQDSDSENPETTLKADNVSLENTIITISDESKAESVNLETSSDPKPGASKSSIQTTSLEDKSLMENSQSVTVIDSSADPDSINLETTLKAHNLGTENSVICISDESKEESLKAVTPEVEVTQLQNHLRRMEESHYSTNEELQATIQELSDLQAQLTQTRSEKEKFREEKTLLLESLYRQTERLQRAKTENENLQKLLHESSSERSVPEREKKLIELLTQGQANRETMISQINELEHKLNEVQRSKELTEEANRCLAERVKQLEITIEDVQFEKRTIEDELTLLKDEQSTKYFETLRLNVLLDIEEAKVKELKAAHASMANENDLCIMMGKVLKEKELLEKKLASFADVLERTKCENVRLTSEINILQEQSIVLNESAARTISDLENNFDLLKLELEKAQKKIVELQYLLKDMEGQIEILHRELQEAREKLNDTENKLQSATDQLEELKNELTREKQKRDDESAEWKQLHEDLLVAVRVANDIKNDIQAQLERTVARLRELEEANAALRQQNTKREKTTPKSLDVLRPPNVPRSHVYSKPPISAPMPAVGPVHGVPKEPSFGKCSRPSLQLVNVKSLIESIENASKQPKTGQLESSGGSKAGSPQRETHPPLPLREQPLTTNRQTQPSVVPVISDLATPNDEKKDPLVSLVEKNGGSKRNALLKWVQNRTHGYPNIEITNFSSSWTDGLALCALLHTYLPHKIPYDSLTARDRQRNFSLALGAAEAEGIPTILNINDMTQQERPDWQKVMAYVKEIYAHFEGNDSV